MGTINGTLMFWRFLRAATNVDFGALNRVMTPAGISEAEWVRRSAACAMEQGRAMGRELIERYAVGGNAETFRFRKEFGWKIGSFAERTGPLVKTDDGDGFYPSAAEGQDILSCLDKVGNSRVMRALTCDENVRHQTVETLWWSDLYDRAKRCGHELTEAQQRGLQLLAPRLEKRMRETCDFVHAPVTCTTNVHQLFASVAMLGLLHQETMCLAGKALQRSMLAAFGRLTESPNIYLKHAAVVALTRQAVSLRGLVPMISLATRRWVRAMHPILRMRCEACDVGDRHQMIESLIAHARLIIPHVHRQDAPLMAAALSDVCNDERESEDLRTAANRAFTEMVERHPRVGIRAFRSR